MGTQTSPDFFNGLVFGFDVGTGSIGYAVRKGKDFKDVGVLICPEDTSDLSGRRGLRSQRRRLRNRNRIRNWLTTQLEEKLGLPSPWTKTESGQIVLKPGLDHTRISNPVFLRCEALEGRLEKPEELHAAIAHLWKRRGKTEVPWKQGEAKEETPEQKKENKKIEGKLNALVKEMTAGDGTKNPDGTPKSFIHPCQLLQHRQKLRIKQREEVWPRDEFQNKEFNLKNEFLAIIEKSTALKNEKSEPLPKLSEIKVTFQGGDKFHTVSAADWILYGETQTVKNKGKERRVYFKTTDCENPGVLGLRWPRFDNRNPGLDLLKPLDELDRPLHVVRRNKAVFKETQFEQALFNFRVIEKFTGKKVLPDIASLNRLRQIYELAKRKSKSEDLKISKSVLKNWAKEFAEKYELIEGQQELVSRAGDGRAKFCSATLRDIKQVLEKLGAGQTIDAIQPLLRVPGESKEQAMARFLGDIRHGLVRHRLNLFLRLLHRLIKKHEKPDFIVVEAVRSLAFSKKKKDEKKKEQKKNRDAKDQVYKKLKDEQQSTSKDAILRYRLAHEVGFECPFCRQPFDQADLFNGNADISHLYPKSLTPCNEFYNLTIAHAKCNRTDMVQFSVYARPCGTADRVETQVRRLKSKIPAKGEVRGLMISDAQWGRMIVVRSAQPTEAEKQPAQMQFF